MHLSDSVREQRKILKPGPLIINRLQRQVDVESLKAMSGWPWQTWSELALPPAMN